MARLLRYRKNDPTHNVFVAVQRWVMANGGSAFVMGGVEVQDWHEGAGKYRVAVKIVGARPKGREDANGPQG